MSFGSVLSALFASDAREEFREPAESFREFWDATYARVNTPKNAWGENVAMFLEVVYGVPEKEEEEETKETKAKPAVDLEVAFISRPSTPPTPVISPTVPTTPTTLPPPPCCLRNTTNTLSTPSRVRHPSLQDSLRSCPSAHIISHCSRVPRPPTPKTIISPAKRRKPANGDKENLSPVQIPSVLRFAGVPADARFRALYVGSKS